MADACAARPDSKTLHTYPFNMVVTQRVQKGDTIKPGSAQPSLTKSKDAKDKDAVVLSLSWGPDSVSCSSTDLRRAAWGNLRNSFLTAMMLCVVAGVGLWSVLNKSCSRCG